MSKCCYIIGASSSSWVKFNPQEGDYVIAADAGLKFLDKLNIKPDLIVGDFDSLGFIPEGKKLILPKIKDVSDLHASLEEGKKLGYQDFIIIGCLGGRIDQSIASIQDAYGFALKGLNITLLSQDKTLKVMGKGQITLDKKEGFLSIFSLSEESLVTINHTKYEVNNYLIKSSFPLGLSNEFKDDLATIQVNKGYILIVY